MEIWEYIDYIKKAITSHNQNRIAAYYTAVTNLKKIRVQYHSNLKLSTILIW